VLRVDRKFEPLTEAEEEWVKATLASARNFVCDYDPEGGDNEASLDSLDRAFKNYLAIESDTNTANDVVLAVGVAFGSTLVSHLGFEWVIASDDYGTDLAVLARPGCGDVTIFPSDLVSKRYERREAPFLADAFAQIKESLNKIAEEWGENS
jgi:hypothetical protein